ncbi:expressed protein [Dictyostelium purpureum]|uniref:Expressed protein n=1 Tax=Dictyostelium purpureum TaxID=5786 RepID=F1A0Q8_DICPU|nr:uncharacterized protein DICPUDRAFT_99602 [Dictyostelium purpureum]EGC30220.1 expressed protein [Dictyostelium purpureum]|eukprot:XP_003293256.1 expressed protein [Dictyostelium purpureum]
MEQELFKPNQSYHHLNNNFKDKDFNVGSDNNNNINNNENNKVSFTISRNESDFSFFFSSLELANSSVSMVELEPPSRSDSIEHVHSNNEEEGEDYEEEFYNQQFQETFSSIFTNQNGSNFKDSTTTFQNIEDLLKEDNDSILLTNSTKSATTPSSSSDTDISFEKVKLKVYNSIISDQQTGSNANITDKEFANTVVNSFEETPECWEYLVNCVDDASNNLVIQECLVDQNEQEQDQEQEKEKEKEKDIQLGSEKKNLGNINKNKTSFDPSNLNYNNIVDFLDTKEISLSTPISPLNLNTCNNENSNCNNNKSPVITLSPLNLNISQPSPKKKISPIPSPSLIEKKLSTSMNEILKPNNSINGINNNTNNNDDNFCKSNNRVDMGFEYQDFKKSFNFDVISPLPYKNLSASCPSVPVSPPSIKSQQQKPNIVLGEPVVPNLSSKVSLVGDGIVNVDGNYFYNEQLYQLQELKKKTHQSNVHNVTPYPTINPPKIPLNNYSLFSSFGVNPITDFFIMNSSQHPPLQEINQIKAQQQQQQQQHQLQQQQQKQLQQLQQLQQQQILQHVNFNVNGCNNSNNNIKNNLNYLNNNFNNANNINKNQNSINNQNIKNINLNLNKSNINNSTMNKQSNYNSTNNISSSPNRPLNYNGNMFNVSNNNNNFNKNISNLLPKQNNTSNNNINYNSMNLNNINYNSHQLTQNVGNIGNTLNQNINNPINNMYNFNIPNNFQPNKLNSSMVRKDIPIKNSTYIYVPQAIALQRSQNYHSQVYN